MYIYSSFHIYFTIEFTRIKIIYIFHNVHKNGSNKKIIGKRLISKNGGIYEGKTFITNISVKY